MAKKRILQPKVGSGLSFHGMHCTKDCSGHRAGWFWQRSHPNQPALSKSNSFNQGATVRNVQTSQGKNLIGPAIRNTQTGQFQKFKKK